MSQHASFPPRLFLIGAQKSATTLLADMLDQQPSVSLGQEKELNFFSDEALWAQGMNWYADRFEGAKPGATWLLDASVSYTRCMVSNPDRVATFMVPKRIKDTVSDPKFIYLLREPVGRAYSEYWHTVRNGREKRAVEQALTPPSGYVNTSNYAAQLAIYLQHFSLDQFLILRSEHVTNHPQKTLNQICDFLGVDNFVPYVRDVGRKPNQGFQLSLAAQLGVKLLGGHDRFYAFAKGVKSLLPDAAAGAVKRSMTQPIPDISDDLRARLADYLDPSVRQLEDMTGHDFSDWPERPAD